VSSSKTRVLNRPSKLSPSAKSVPLYLSRGGEAYFSGNAPGLTSYFGVAKSKVPDLVGHWISVSPTDSGFQSVTAGLTLASALKEVSPSGSISKGKKKIVNGSPAISIVGTDAASGTRVLLFVSQSGKHLPVEAVESSGSGEAAAGEIVTFTRWAEKFHAPTPSGSIPISSIGEPPSSS
jgi:hypothetical protein